MIPKEVLEAAKGRLKYGGRVVEICQYKREVVYCCDLSGDVIIGFPEFYLWNGKRARVIGGVEALDLIPKLST